MRVGSLESVVKSPTRFGNSLANQASELASRTIAMPATTFTIEGFSLFSLSLTFVNSLSCARGGMPNSDQNVNADFSNLIWVKLRRGIIIAIFMRRNLAFAVLFRFCFAVIF